VAPDALVVPLVLSVVLAATSVPIFVRRRGRHLCRPVAIVVPKQDDEEAT
jgi:hypothetical protein